MTFDLARGCGYAVMRKYNPSPLPPGFGPTWYPKGWCGSFLPNCNIPPTSDDFDPNHSLGYTYEAGRTCIFPTRSQSYTLWGSQGRWYGGIGAGSGWTQVNVATGATSLVTLSGFGDPAIDGPALDMQTGGTTSSVAGVQRTLGTVPNSFSFGSLLNPIQIGTDPTDALNIWLQNNIGRTLMTRFYDNAVDVHLSGSWQRLISHDPVNAFWELWVECVDNGDGTNTIKAYAGTQLVPPTLTGTMPTGQISNNMLSITQQSVAHASRHSQVTIINVGPTQLPDNMTICSPILPNVPTAPTTGSLIAYMEDVSVNISLNSNVQAAICSTDVANWVGITLSEITPPWGNGEIDNTKDIRMFQGTGTFAASGTNLRWYVQTSGGVLAPLHGVIMYWD